MRSNNALGLLLSQLALCLVLVASAVDAVRAHGDLNQTITRQQANAPLIGKVDAQLDALARGTQQLAQEGNPHAAQIVATLAQNGVHISPRGAGR